MLHLRKFRKLYIFFFYFSKESQERFMIDFLNLNEKRAFVTWMMSE